MDIAASLIKLIFGSKADKDRKQIEPYLEKIKAVYPAIEALSNDELRARSEALKKQIADFIAADEARIVELKAKLELAETSLEEKEKVSKEIDETTKRIDDRIEDKLDEILPEAFAIMKDTARRFAENDTVVVTATDFDRNLAAEKDFVTIDGDKAVVTVSTVTPQTSDKALFQRRDDHLTLETDLEGSELFEVSLGELTPTKPADEAADLTVGTAGTSIAGMLCEGRFALYLAGEPFKSGLKAQGCGKLKKAVFSIELDEDEEAE